MRLIELNQTEGHPGHYSTAAACGDFLYISGQLPIDWKGTRTLVPGGAAEHAVRCLENLGAVLESEGLRREDVVKTTVFIPDIEMWPAVDAEYAAFFGEHKPARSVVPTTGLHYGALVEIEAVVWRGGK